MTAGRAASGVGVVQDGAAGVVQDDAAVPDGGAVLAGGRAGRRSDAVWDLAPERLRAAADAVGGLRADRGVYLAPVRHHSPACAVAVRAAIEELRPAAVLIEGPEEFTRLIPDLLHEATRPPIAVLSLGDTGTGSSSDGHEPGSGSGFYPLASFSPEWVALHAGRDVGAELRFIDRSFGERSAAERAVSGSGGSGSGGSGPGGAGPDAAGPDAAGPNAAGPNGGPYVAGPSAGGADAQPDPFARTLMSERYLAHSEAVAALARRLGCRDHDEVWDHLFESRPSAELADWRAVFDDVFAWAALARLDYEESVLAADGSLDREARMAARVAEAAAEVDGPVLVVTGAFHTLALVEALSGAAEGAPVRDRQPEGGFGPVAQGEAWLVRYDHERLDGLRGYGAGMPSPGYYERLHVAHLRELAVGGVLGGSVNGSVNGSAYGSVNGSVDGSVDGAATKAPGRTNRKSAAKRAVPGAAADAATGVTSAAVASGPVGARALAAEILVDVARGAVDRGHAVSLPQVSAAAESATRLADLRERAFAGRTDLLDAMRSCYVQDDGGVGGPGEPERPLGLAIAEVFGGRALGDVPPGSASPPLVRDVRERVRAVKLTIDDSVPRTARLDARRTASHRAKRQVLALLDFVGAGFGQLVSGPDHVAGRGLGLITEEWQYCWTPLVEARLVEMVHLGATLEAVAVARLTEAEARLSGTGSGSGAASGTGTAPAPGTGTGSGSGAGAVSGAGSASVDALARLVAQALVIGMGSHLPRIVSLLRVTLDTDRDVDSVVSGARRLLGLWEARIELGAEEYAGELLDLVSQALATTAYLVSDLGKVRAEDEDAAIGTLIGLRSLLRDAAAADRVHGDAVHGDAVHRDGVHGDGVHGDAVHRDGVHRDGAGADGIGSVNRIAVERELARLRDDEDTAPAVSGALLALGFTDGEVADDVLVTRVRGALAAGADPGAAVRFLGGVMRAAPDLILHTPEMFDAVDDALRALDGGAFLAVLPDLRRAFTWLRPTETHRLAKRVAERTGARVDQVDVRVALSEEDLATGLALDRELAAVLERDGLAHWVGGTSASISDASVPDAAVPDAAVPDAAVPDAAVPDGAATDSAATDMESAVGVTPAGGEA
ncbi:DUF5682 family protein [Promicromonospora sp. NPDC057488]|uniref:DUF5682 family protein n=1 Tax=Promicromonospora sp. NPDC057488 TaxID=3346147 RepID=UPI00366B7289